MPVYSNLVIYATSWQGTGRSITHADLVRVPDGWGGFQYGLFDQQRGEWLETFDEAAALERLRSWVHEESTPERRARSQITTLGRNWLAETIA
jgi:hypothetical protein